MRARAIALSRVSTRLARLLHSRGTLFLLLAGCGHHGAGLAEPEASYEAQLQLEVISFGAMPPPDDGSAVVLFDGASWDGWIGRDGSPIAWTVEEDGSVTAVGGDAYTRRQFGDFQLHLEFLCPVMAAKGQGRANSGVYLHGRYEVQVLDSYGDKPAPNGCGAIYSLVAPLASASKPPGQWQSYDIVFRAPRYGPADQLVERPRVTILHNGIVIHNNLEIPGVTPGGLDRGNGASGPLMLQYHGDPVRYRNIWIRELD